MMSKTWTAFEIAFAIVCIIAPLFFGWLMFISKGLVDKAVASKDRAVPDTPHQAALRQRLGCKDRSKSVSIAFSEVSRYCQSQ